jgi:hypothetical protein
MKNTTFIKLALIMCLIILNQNIEAQNVKALKIVYNITYPTTKPLIKSSTYKNAVILVQGNKFLLKTISEFDDVATIVSNDCGSTVYTSLTDLPIILKTTREDTEKHLKKYNMQQPTIIVTSETKQILGFTCKKIMTQTKYDGKTFTSYSYIYEDKNPSYCINSNTSNLTFGINGGLMLGCENDMTQGSIQVWTAISISEELVDSSFFNIPSNYTIMTLDEYTQRLTTDKQFLKQCKKIGELSQDGKKAIRKDLWKSFPKELLQVAVQGSQQVEASQQFQNNPNSQTLNNYANVVKNNNTLSPADAINANKTIISSSVTNNIKPESSAVTNGSSTSSGKDGNSPEAMQCQKQIKQKWEGTTEYINYMKNPNCNKMATISKRKLLEMALESCSQYFNQKEIDGFNNMISSLTTQINGMEDCKTYNFGK